MKTANVLEMADNEFARYGGKIYKHSRWFKKCIRGLGACIVREIVNIEDSKDKQCAIRGFEVEILTAEELEQQQKQNCRRHEIKHVSFYGWLLANNKSMQESGSDHCGHCSNLGFNFIRDKVVTCPFCSDMKKRNDLLREYEEQSQEISQ